MVAIFIEGFDKYGPTGQNNPTEPNLVAQGEWSGSSTNTSIVAPLSATGNAFQIGSQGFVQNNISKTFPASYSRIIGGVRVKTDFSNPLGFAFSDGAAGVTDFSLGYIATGQIRLWNGFFSTTVATSTLAVVSNSTHYLEWDVTIGAAGAYAVYLDGALLFSGTGNTRSGSSTTINQFGAFTSPGSNFNPSGTLIIDDLYLFDSTGTTNNSVLLSNPRIETRYPSGDSQTQWTNGGNTLVAAGITQTSVASTSSSVNAPGANELVLLKVTPAVSCTLNSVALSPGTTSTTAKFKSVLYSDSAGSPSTLVATGTEVIGVTSGTALNLPFGAGQSLTGGTSYWIGHINDTSINIGLYDSSTLGQKKANTYGSGAPAGPLSGMTTGQSTWLMWGVCTGAATNWQSVAQNPAAATRSTDGAGDSSTITSSTATNEDLYSFPALSATVNLIYTVAVKTNLKLTSTGARTFDLRVKSNLTDSPGSTSGYSPSSSYAWYGSYFDLDPNGNITWTRTAANAATAGPKVAT